MFGNRLVSCSSCSSSSSDNPVRFSPAEAHQRKDVYANRGQDKGSMIEEDENVDAASSMLSFISSSSPDSALLKRRSPSRSKTKRRASRCVAFKVTSLAALGCASTRCTISILGKAFCGLWGECVVGRVTNISNRSVFVASTLSVVQAIQLDDVSALLERKGMSWIPTLKIGRGRRGGAPFWSKKGDKD